MIMHNKLLKNRRKNYETHSHISNIDSNIRHCAINTKYIEDYLRRQEK